MVPPGLDPRIENLYTKLVESQLVSIAGWVAAFVVTSLVAINAFFISKLVNKLERNCEAVLGLSIKVDHLAHEVGEHSTKVESIDEKFSTVCLDVAILKRDSENKRRRSGGNGACLEDIDG